jgi:transcriptional regulator with XRE-family HTH domain
VLTQGFDVSDEVFFEVGARIAALRGAMKQSEFAERLGVHRNSVVGWEAGKRLPDGESLVRMSEQFNADIHVLLMGKQGGLAPELRPDEEKLLADYRAAHSDARERIRQIAATAANSPKRMPKDAETLASPLVHGDVHGQVVNGLLVNNQPLDFSIHHGLAKPIRKQKT